VAYLLAFCGTLSVTSIASAAAPKPDAPPAGIVPVTVTLDQVLERFHAVEGTFGLKTYTEDWEFDEFGLSGTEHDVHAGADYRETTQVGPFHYEAGKFNGQLWSQNENGLTILATGFHERDEQSAEALLENQKMLKERKLLGEIPGAVPHYVISSTSNGHPIWIFVNEATGYVDRFEESFSQGRLAVVFDDYRTTAGVVQPYHIGLSMVAGRHEEHADYRLVKFNGTGVVKTAELAIPANLRRLDEFPAGNVSVELPAKFIDSDIIVRLNVGGRGLDFVLDSGSSGIVFDRGVAQSLGLKRYGEQVATTAGTYVQSQIIVPEIAVGSIKMHDVAAYSLPFNYQAREDVKVVGLLGFDFIDDAVIKVDYFNKKVTAIEPSRFEPDFPDASAIPASLDDQVPVVEAQIGDALGEHFIVDTGSNTTLIFSQFAKDHPGDVKDQGLGSVVKGNFPYIFAEGVGGDLSLEPVQLKTFVFANTNFHEQVVFRTVGAAPFEGDDHDGLIGYQFLHFYDVYFDYGHNRVIFAPNDFLKKYKKPAR
jgi:hypothetical protein